jgi:hypothetical protein
VSTIEELLGRKIEAPVKKNEDYGRTDPSR